MKCKTCKKSCKYFLWLIVIAFVGIQFVLVDTSNPPVTGVIDAPEEVVAILRRSCFDCHSNETVWPWYAHIAPMSWLVADDVHEAREHLNFSIWSDYSTKKKNHSQHEIGEVVEEGEMPLWYYLPLHPSAELSEEDITTLITWSEANSGGGKLFENESEEDELAEHERGEDDD